MTAIEREYQVILDRRADRQEGSYTCYLFDQGIDKILKKVGEECTEMVIAARITTRTRRCMRSRI